VALSGDAALLWSAVRPDMGGLRASARHEAMRGSSGAAQRHGRPAPCC
jgi:hypothetical protein